jgi:hypothetical protein
MDVFLTSSNFIRKTQLITDTRQFIKQTLETKTIKALMLLVKNNLPSILDFGHAYIYLCNLEKDRLFTLSIDEEAERVARKAHGFEQEYFVDPHMLINYPIETGMAGFAFQSNAIGYLNQCSEDLGKTKRCPSVFCVDKVLIQPEFQDSLGKVLAHD